MGVEEDLGAVRCGGRQRSAEDHACAITEELGPVESDLDLGRTALEKLGELGAEPVVTVVVATAEL